MRYPEENEVVSDYREDANSHPASSLDDIIVELWRAEDVLQSPEEIAEFEEFLDNNPNLLQ